MIHSGVNTIQLIHTASGKYCCNVSRFICTGSEFFKFQYRKQQAHSLYPFRFPLPSVRDQRCADLIVALLLCWHPSSHIASGKYCCNLSFQVVIHINKQRFNTASSRYIHSILFVFPSLRSGTRDVRTSSSLCSSAGTLRRISQAVSTVATYHSKQLYI